MNSMLVKSTLLNFLVFINLLALHAQNPEQMEARLRSQHGFEKLETLTWLANYYEPNELKKAQKYGKEADQIADNLIESDVPNNRAQERIVVEAKLAYARVQYQRESYVSAKRIFNEARSYALQQQYDRGAREAELYLLKLDSLALAGEFKENILKRTFNDIELGSAIANSKKSLATSTELKKARYYEKRGDTLTANRHYQKAANLLRDQGEFEEADKIESKIKTFDQLKHIDSIRAEIVMNPDGATKIIAKKLREDTTGYLVRPALDSNIVKQKQDELAQLQTMAKSLERDQNYEDALAYYKRLTALQRKWEKDSLEQLAIHNLAEREMERLRQQNEIADLNITAIQQEKEAEVRLKNILSAIAVLIGVATFVIFFLYITKRRKHRSLTTAYQDLDQAKGQLEEAERHISKLLEQQVSPEIAETLIADKPQRRKQFVAIMFLDIRGFTPMAEKMDPEELIEYQNNVFGFMIEIIRQRDGNINQFMGDGFMATFGAPVSHGNDARNAFLAAKDILKEIKVLNEERSIPHTTLGIGIHAGDVVTGNVGTESRRQFSVTGNTVIVAARIEQLNKKYHSQLIITEEVNNLLQIGDLAEDPESMEVKVKGRKEPVKILVMEKVATPENTIIKDPSP